MKWTAQIYARLSAVSIINVSGSYKCCIASDQMCMCAYVHAGGGGGGCGMTALKDVQDVTALKDVANSIQGILTFTGKRKGLWIQSLTDTTCH